MELGELPSVLDEPRVAGGYASRCRYSPPVFAEFEVPMTALCSAAMMP
jgi:hypothetical protein